MNILIIRDEFKIHGPGLHALKFGTELQKRGHKVVFCASGGELDDTIRSNGIKKVTVEGLSFSNHRILYLLSNSKQIKKIVNSEHIEIVIGFNLLSTISAYVACLRSKKIKFIDVVVGEGKEKYLRFFPFKYIAISEYMKGRLLSFGLNEEKISIVYPSTIELEQFDLSKKKKESIRNEFNISEDDVLVTSVAMFNRLTDTISKGQDSIAKCIPELIKKNPHIKVLFVGSGEKKPVIESSLKQYANNVFFAGKRNDVPDIMFATDIFCHYPDQETFGMVVTEAMAAKCPVVARKIGGIANIVVDGKTGFLVNTEDELISKVLELADNNKLRETLGIKGRMIVEEKYTLPKVIDRLEQLF